MAGRNPRTVAELEREIRQIRGELERRRAVADEVEARHRAVVENIHRINLEWRETLDALSDLVLLADSEGNILRVNRTAEMWGLGSVRDLPGKSLHKALHPSCDDENCYLEWAWNELTVSPAEPEPVSRNAAGGQSVPRVVEREFEDWRLGRRIRLTASSIGTDKLAGMAFAVFVLRDVTVYYHRRVNRSRREQLETLGHLVRGLAHEIGNPLAAVKTSIQVLARNFDSFPRAKIDVYLERVARETDRIQAILDRVLSEQQWKIGPLEEIGVHELFTRVTDLYAAEMVERHLRFELTQTDEPAQVLVGDKAAVETVLAIVLDNAMDACEPGGRVSVEVNGDGRQVTINVCDSGRGMSPGDLERAFQPFFSTKSRGSGLGITHANHLMGKMRGRLEIDSAKGEGSTVRLIFEAGVRSVEPEPPAGA